MQTDCRHQQIEDTTQTKEVNIFDWHFKKIFDMTFVRKIGVLKYFYIYFTI